MAAPTVPSLKQSFLAEQTTLLSQPLAPSRTWQAANDASEEPIPERAVEDVLFNLNHTIQQHSRRVHAPQASRHIAQQISAVYTKSADRRLGQDEEDDDQRVTRELDLTGEDVIEALPSSWPSQKEVNAYPAEARRYTESVERLSELNERRQEVRSRVDRLQRLKAMLEPLKTEDGGAGIQENLVTRAGPVEKELEKMRLLLARVGGRVQALPADKTLEASPRVPEAGDLRAAQKRRVDEFLADESVFPS